MKTDGSSKHTHSLTLISRSLSIIYIEKKKNEKKKKKKREKKKTEGSMASKHVREHEARPPRINYEFRLESNVRPW